MPSDQQTNKHRDRVTRRLRDAGKEIVALGPCATDYDAARSEAIRSTMGAIEQLTPRGDEMMQEFRAGGLVK